MSPKKLLGKPDRGPFVSVVIPTYNRPMPLTACLRALAALDYPSDRYEVIVVDDGGTPSLGPVVAPFRPLMDLKLIQGPHGGAPQARNRGMDRARGELVVFTDDDCIPHPEWITELVQAWLQHPQAMVGGRTYNLLTANPYSQVAQCIIDAAYAFSNQNPTHARFFTSNNLAAPRKDLMALGGFDEAFRVHASEDRELCSRWLHAGRPLVYNHKALVGHIHPLCLRSFMELYFRHGRGAYHYHRFCRLRGLRSLRDAWGFRRCLYTYVGNSLRKQNGITRLQTWTLVALWEALNFMGYGYEAIIGDGYAGRPKMARGMP